MSSPRGNARPRPDSSPDSSQASAKCISSQSSVEMLQSGNESASSSREISSSASEESVTLYFSEASPNVNATSAPRQADDVQNNNDQDEGSEEPEVEIITLCKNVTFGCVSATNAELENLIGDQVRKSTTQESADSSSFQAFTSEAMSAVSTAASENEITSDETEEEVFYKCFPPKVVKVDEDSEEAETEEEVYYKCFPPKDGEVDEDDSDEAETEEEIVHQRIPPKDGELEEFETDESEDEDETLVEGIPPKDGEAGEEETDDDEPEEIILQCDLPVNNSAKDEKHVKGSITGGPFDWPRENKYKIRFADDGTMTFFWRAHTLTVLAFLIGVLVYVALFENPMKSSEYNAKRGLIACVSVFLLLGVTITPDGPFLRPHPAFWRFIFCLSILYEVALIFLLFQTATDARLLLRHVDPKLGTVLEEKSYGGNCYIYDLSVPQDPWHNVWDKFDLFVPMHFFGWWLKTLVLRDWWLCWVISIMFEILEYTLEHQLPNFSECWWDHWILDALVCNGGGILLGMQTLNFFQVRTYKWRGLWNIPDYKGKLKRIIAQFGPHMWIDFDWKPTSSFGRWMSVLAITFVFLVAELNTFYLKFVLWVPPGHYLNLVRLFALLFWGAVGLRETFQYLDDSTCKTFGRQSWIIIAIVSTEFLIVAKFDPVTITKPLPGHIGMLWLIGLAWLTTWTIWNFGIHRRLLGQRKKED